MLVSPSNRFGGATLMPLMVLALLAPSCSDKDVIAAEHAKPPLSRLPSGPAGDSVRAALKAAGGWETWEQKRTVSYLKTTERLDAESNVLHSVVQRHRYVLQPHLKIRIDWVEDRHEMALVNDGEQAWKLMNGAIETASSNQSKAANSTYGSHYVFCMPFKLTDPGARFTYVEPSELESDLTVGGVRVNYESWAGASGGKHIWTYYFDEQGLLAANDFQRVDAPDKVLFSRYYDFIEVQGLRLPTRRLAWRTSPAHEQLVPSTRITYAEIVFDETIPDELFVRPDDR